MFDDYGLRAEMAALDYDAEDAPMVIDACARHDDAVRVLPWSQALDVADGCASCRVVAL